MTERVWQNGGGGDLKAVGRLVQLGHLGRLRNQREGVRAQPPVIVHGEVGMGSPPAAAPASHRRAPHGAARQGSRGSAEAACVNGSSSVSGMPLGASGAPEGQQEWQLLIVVGRLCESESDPTSEEKRGSFQRGIGQMVGSVA